MQAMEFSNMSDAELEALIARIGSGPTPPPVVSPRPAPVALAPTYPPAPVPPPPREPAAVYAPPPPATAAYPPATAYQPAGPTPPANVSYTYAPAGMNGMAAPGGAGYSNGIGGGGGGMPRVNGEAYMDGSSGGGGGVAAPPAGMTGMAGAPMNGSTADRLREKNRAGRAVDVCFVVDCTGSMTYWIAQVKTKVLEIARSIKTNQRVSAVRLAFVGYRDYFYPQDQRYVQVPFTSDELAFERAVSGVEALYCKGNDEPEDLLGGLDKALRMDWQSKSRVLILIADAPCHGQQYHDLQESSANASYNDPLKPDTLLRAMGQKFKVDLTFCRIKADTDKMIRAFRPLYEDKRGASGRVLTLREIQLDERVDDFLPKIIGTITESINRANV